MLRYMKFSTLVAMALVLLTVGLEAKKKKDDHGDLTELRLRRNQLMITEATPFCVDGGMDMLRIRGTHLGSLAPHVTLGLVVIGDVMPPVAAPDGAQAGVQHPLQEETVLVPDAFCDDPGTSLLTVMRGKMKWRHRLLNLTKKDLAVFEVAVGGVTQVNLDAAVQDLTNDHNADVADLQGQVNGLGTTVTSLGGQVNTVNATVTSVGSQLNLLSGTVVSIGGDVNTLKTTSAAHDTRITTLEVAGPGGGGSLVTYNPAVHCRGTIGAFVAWETGTQQSPSAFCRSQGVPFQRGLALFPDADVKKITKTLVLPSGWDGSVDLVLYWTWQLLQQANEQVRWSVKTACASQTDVGVNPTTGGTVTVVGNRPVIEFELVVSPPTPLLTTGCASGDMMLVEVSRDTADPYTGNLAVYGAELTIGRN